MTTLADILSGAFKPQQGPPLYRPLQGGETRPNPDGSYSTEITMTDQDPQGRWEVYPSLWMGPNGPTEMRRGPAMQAANDYERLGYQFPRFNDLAESERWATDRSHGGGASQVPLAAPLQSLTKLIQSIRR